MLKLDLFNTPIRMWNWVQGEFVMGSLLIRRKKESLCVSTLALLRGIEKEAQADLPRHYCRQRQHILLILW